jgi:transposase
MADTNGNFMGIDVGKTWLDVAVWNQEEAWRFRNDENGVEELLILVTRLEPKLIVLEATGGYEQLAFQKINLSGFPVAIVNPTRVRALAKATGKLAKTDVIDAHLIAEYAYKIRPEPQKTQQENEVRIRALVTRRIQLVEMGAAEKNRLSTAHSSIQNDIREHIDWITSQITILDLEIKQLFDTLPEWQECVERLDSIPGVGFVTAISITAEMSELGQLNRQKISALAGLAPYNKDSGKKHGKRRIFGGRKGIRRVLYMACLSAIKCNPVIRAFYSRLIEKGKLFKVAITACMRKMLVIMNALERDKVFWQEHNPIPVLSLS